MADDDPTVRIAPAAPARSATGRPTWMWPTWIWIVSGGVLVCGVAALAVLLLTGPNRPAAPPVPGTVTMPTKSPPQAEPTGYAARVATEAEILADAPAELTVFRFAANLHVLVLDFPTLRAQGRMLNRVAAFAEKSGAPHDRPLDDSGLDTVIRSQGATIETFYYGHDYSAEELRQFFIAADRAGVVLDEEEAWLHRLLLAERWDAANAVGALISLPREGADSFVDHQVRAVILRHELSHGEYFTNPDYAAYSRRVWSSVFTDSDRTHFRVFLGAQGYDTALEDLMINESQAYLMHTADPRFVSARELQMEPRQVHALQASFLQGMPSGWLRDHTPEPTGLQ